jgi:hypothetical protein
VARSWRSVRAGRQYVNLDYLGTKTISDTLESIEPTQYQGKPQLVAVLTKLQMAVAINTTSCGLLEKSWGDDFDSWVGKKVSIKKGSAAFGKSKVDAIIVAPAGK